MSAPDSTAALGPAPLRLLGAPALHAPGGSTPFSAERPYQLLAYLAVHGGWIRRDALADLLYPGRGLEAARSNLRKVLLLARRVEGVGTIEQQGDLLRWQPDSDLQRFEQACTAGRAAEALALYGGPLLHGLDNGWSPAGAEWLQAERSRVEARWRDAASIRLRELDADPPAAAALAQTLLQHDALDDEAMQALLAAQSRLGRSTLALQQLDAYTQTLSDRLGIAPSAAVQQLAGTLRSGAAAPTHGGSPPEEAPLIGRRHELALIRERFERTDCRLLTLLGPGGIGKTALARAALAQVLAPASAGAARWVGLETLASVSEVPPHIAAACGIAALPNDDPWRGLASALVSRGPAPIALVLDNLEHLALADEIAALLAAVPALRILATSRVALGIAGEWRLPLDGLPLPDADESDAAVLRVNDAVRLFERHALPLAPDFRLEDEAADVVRLVHAVEGLPLALRLLASWRRLMPVREILAELAGSLELLDASTPHERSVRAAFERSWQQLGAHEQRVLAQMALLPQPLDREMLRSVLDAPLAVLAALVDRSLVRSEAGSEGAGRFVLHALIRRCAEPLASDAEGVHERHARHVAAALARGQRIEGDNAAHAQAAWAWAVARADVAVLAALGGPLGSFHERSARRSDGVQALQAGLRALEAVNAEAGASSSPSTHERQRARLPLLLGLGDLLYGQGELDAARTVGSEALALATRLADARRAAHAHALLGRLSWQRGHYAEARDHVTQELALLRVAGTAAVDTIATIASLGLMEKAIGHFDTALAHYREAMTLARAHNRLGRHLALANNLGSLLRTCGHVDESVALLQEALALARAQGSRGDVPFLLLNLALASELSGAFDAALPWIERAMAERDASEPYLEAAVLLARARVAPALGGTVVQAGADVRAALEIAARLRLQPLTVQCLASAGLVLARAGERVDGLAIVLWAMAHPEFARSERIEAQQRIDQLAPAEALLAQARAALAAETPMANVIARLPVAWRPLPVPGS